MVDANLVGWGVLGGGRWEAEFVDWTSLRESASSLEGDEKASPNTSQMMWTWSDWQ